VLEDMRYGLLHPLAAEAFRETSPALFRVVVQEIFKQDIMDYPRQVRHSIGILIGSPIDAINQPEILASIQSPSEEEKMGQQAGVSPQMAAMITPDEPTASQKLSQ
jgi:hypothetical protein